MSTATKVLTRLNSRPLALWKGFGVALIGYFALQVWIDWQVTDQASAPPQWEALAGPGVAVEETQPAPISHERLSERDATSEVVLAAKAGDTLDGLLKRLGLDSKMRSAVVQALTAEFDPQALQPGHEVVIRFEDNQKTPQQLLLKIDAGVKILLSFGDPLTVSRLTPAITSQERAVRFKLDRSVYASLKAANIPTRFAQDLSLMLAPLIQFDRAFKGGEKFEILWHEYPLAEGREAKPPNLRYVRIEMGDRTIEATRSNGTDSHSRIYKNGELVRTLVTPVDDGQISSIFGPRKHPVYGNVRMHTGVDYSALRGARVTASAPGEILYMGRRRGYGRVIEIQHEKGVVTRYAHLESFAAGLERDSRVAAGDEIGSVGASGIATGPNLHFEVLSNGRPLDPLYGARTVLAKAINSVGGDNRDLFNMREAFDRVLFDLKRSENG